MFKVSEMKTIEPGHTIPGDNKSKGPGLVGWVSEQFERRTPPDLPSTLTHMPKFERLRGELDEVKAQMSNVRIEQGRFETYVEEQRRGFDNEIGRLQIELERVEGDLDVHIKSVFPKKKLVDDPDATEPTEPNGIARRMQQIKDETDE
jgi:hypothetical protein